jgi:pilus assembly protein CpaF
MIDMPVVDTAVVTEDANVEARDRLASIRAAVHGRVIGELGEKAQTMRHFAIVQRVGEVLDMYIDAVGLPLGIDARNQLLRTVIADVLGYGPLQPLLEDEEISDIVVNGPDKVYVERFGRLERVPVHFDNNQHLLDVIQRMVVGAGRRVDETSPMCDARLPDGSRINVIIPPLAVKGPALTIRKLRRKPLSVDQLIANGTLTAAMIEFLKACVIARMNILVAGGGTSGKTTMLDVLSGFIPRTERIVTVEDTAELRLRQRHVIRLESRPSNAEGRGIVSIRDLVVNTLRMRPDRIVVGEVRGGEALDMLQAMNTGHDGSLTTVHANSTRDSISRLETLVLMAGTELPSRAIRDQIASAINIIVMLDRLRDGSRRVTGISEVVGIDGNEIELEDIFVYQQFGFDGGKVHGSHIPTGTIPRCLGVIEAAGLSVPLAIFQPAPLEVLTP